MAMLKRTTMGVMLMMVAENNRPTFRYYFVTIFRPLVLVTFCMTVFGLSFYLSLYLSVVWQLSVSFAMVKTCIVVWHNCKNVRLVRRTLTVACSTYSWWVTTYVGKLSAGGQPTRSTQRFSSSRGR